MGRHIVVAYGRLPDDGTMALGRAVVAGGVIIGLMLGLSWWLLPGVHGTTLPTSELTVPRGEGSAPLVLPVPPSGEAVPPMPPTTPDGAASPSPTLPAPYSDADGPGASTGAAPSRPVIVVTARYVTTSVWDNGYVGRITITNVSTVAQSFDVRIDLPSGVTVVSAWNGSGNSGSNYSYSYGGGSSNYRSGSNYSYSGGSNYSYSGGSNYSSGSNANNEATVITTRRSITFRGGTLGAQGTAVVEFKASKDRNLDRPQEFEPTSCTVNGNACG